MLQNKNYSRKRYQTAGNATEEINNQKQWLNNWMDHPEFKKRLSNDYNDIESGKPIDDFIKSSKDKLNSTNYIYAGDISSNDEKVQQLMPHYKEIYSDSSEEELKNIIKNDILLKQGTNFPQYSKIFQFTPINNSKTTPVHEFTHSTNLDDHYRKRAEESKYYTDLKDKMDKRFNGYLDYYPSNPYKGYPGQFRFETFGENSKLWDEEKLEKSINQYDNNLDISNFKYIEQSTEVYPRIMEMRYIINAKPGEIFDQDKLNEVKKLMPNEELFKYYSDDQVINMLNTFASNNINNYNNKAKTGGNIKKYQWAGDLVNSNILPEFTTKAKRTPKVSPFVQGDNWKSKLNRTPSVYTNNQVKQDNTRVVTNTSPNIPQPPIDYLPTQKEFDFMNQRYKDNKLARKLDNPNFNVGRLGSDLINTALVLDGAYAVNAGLKHSAKKLIPLIDNAGSKYLPNAHKLNPWAFKFNSNAYYRTLGKEGFKDAAKSGKLRANLKGDGSVLNRPSDVAYFSKGKVGDYPGKEIIAETKLPLYKRGDINPITGLTIRGRHGGYKNINKDGFSADVDIKDANFYKRHWLKGYKQIEIPKNSNYYKPSPNKTFFNIPPEYVPPKNLDLRPKQLSNTPSEGKKAVYRNELFKDNDPLINPDKNLNKNSFIGGNSIPEDYSIYQGLTKKRSNYYPTNEPMNADLFYSYFSNKPGSPKKLKDIPNITLNRSTPRRIDSKLKYKDSKVRKGIDIENKSNLPFRSWDIYD